MYKEVLSGIENIGIYPAISLAVFFVFFSIVGTWVVKSKKQDFENVSRMPLSEDKSN